jgi:hypothetical protein
LGWFDDSKRDPAVKVAELRTRYALKFGLPATCVEVPEADARRLPPLPDVTIIADATLRPHNYRAGRL